MSGSASGHAGQQEAEQESFEDAREDSFDEDAEVSGRCLEEDASCQAMDVESTPRTAKAAPAAPTALVTAVQSSPELPLGEWALHRAAFAGDASELKSALVGISKAQLRALDPQGNSALHVAVLRRHTDCVNLLLEAGLPGGLRNARGWGALYQAIEMQDRDLALLLLQADMAHVKADVKAKKQAVLNKLWELPDFSTQLHWQLSSSVPGVGMLLSRYAPHDTYTIWKQGCQIRVDGSLMGVREGGQSLLPEWKRGHFSLLYNGAGGGENGKPLAAFVNWTKKKWVDLQAARKRMGSVQETMLAKQVDELMAEPQVVLRKVKTSGFKFTPVSGWLTKEVTEKVEGWDTKVYEASGGMVSETKYKAPCDVPPQLSWEQYLALIFEDDVCEQEALNPLGGKMFSEKAPKPQAGPQGGRRRASPAAHMSSSTAPRTAAPGAGQDGKAGGGDSPGEQASFSGIGKEADGDDDMVDGFPGGGPAAGSGPHLQASASMHSVRAHGAGDTHAGSSADAGNSAKDKGKGAKKLTGKCWMAAGFPLSLQQLLPLLDVIGSANKHIAKVSKFLAKYGSMDRFPVKIQVPIIFTVYALVQFKKFKLTSADTSSTAGNSSFFKRKGGSSSSSSSAPLPAGFFEVPEDFEKYEPKLFSRAQDQFTTEDDDIDL